MEVDKKVDEDKSFWLEFIEVYRSLPSLWNTKSEGYKNKHIKEVELEILVEKYQEKYPNADEKDVKKKIHVLRTNFRRELRRLNKLNETGDRVTYENCPGLWYFEALSFIEDIEPLNKPAKYAQIEYLQNDEEEEEEEILSLRRKKPRQNKFQDETSTSRKTRTNIEDDEDEVDDAPPMKKKVIQQASIDELIGIASRRLKAKPSSFQKGCVFWASKLEKMDPGQAAIAEKLIAEVLFHGDMGQLEMDAFVATSGNSLTLYDEN